MKLINIDDREIGKYYMIYRKANGVFKSVGIFKYEGIFGDFTERTINNYQYGVTTNTSTHPIMEHDEAVTFELDDEEEFIHVTMEMVIQNV